jgi:hypothetical protein
LKCTGLTMNEKTSEQHGWNDYESVGTKGLIC